MARKIRRHVPPSKWKAGDIVLMTISRKDNICGFHRCTVLYSDMDKNMLELKDNSTKERFILGTHDGLYVSTTHADGRKLNIYKFANK